MVAKVVEHELVPSERFKSMMRIPDCTHQKMTEGYGRNCKKCTFIQKMHK